jgi:hypothetical protein
MSSSVKYTYSRRNNRAPAPAPKTKSQIKNQNKRKAARKQAKGRGKEMTDEEWNVQTNELKSVPVPSVQKTTLPKSVNCSEPTYMDVLQRVKENPKLLQKTKITCKWVAGTIPPATIKKMSWADINELEDEQFGYNEWSLDIDEGYDSW